MQPRVPSYSHDPSSSFSARDPYAEDINNMTPKQLDYARHNVHLAQAPSAASACKQGPYKTPSDGVASAISNARVTESAVTKGTPSLAHTNVSSQLTQSAYHKESSPLNKSDGKTAAPVTQVEVQVKTANSGSTDSYSDVTSSTPKTKKSPIPYEFSTEMQNQDKYQIRQATISCCTYLG
eukprot:scaffold79609_cov45-Cyclotella_meneghiniana.AAC.2